MRRSICLLCLLMIGVLTASAQFNDTTHYRVTVSASGSINKADETTAYLLNNSLNFGIKKKDMWLNATNNWIYGRQNNNLTNNDLSSSLFFNLYKTLPHFYYWGLVNYN